MRIHKRTDVSYRPASEPSNSLTAYDIASKIRILSGQKLIIQQEDETLAEYEHCTDVMLESYKPFMQLPFDFMVVLGKQIILYVGGEAV